MAGRPYYFSCFVRPVLRAENPERCTSLVRTYHRHSTMSFGEFVSHFLNLWRHSVGVPDLEAANILISQTPPEWKDWASEVMYDMIEYVPYELNPSFSFEHFAAELLQRWALIRRPPGELTPPMPAPIPPPAPQPLMLNPRPPCTTFPTSAPTWTPPPTVPMMYPAYPYSDALSMTTTGGFEGTYDAPLLSYTSAIQGSIPQAPPSTLPSFHSGGGDPGASSSRFPFPLPPPEYTQPLEPILPYASPRMREIAGKRTSSPPPLIVISDSEPSSPDYDADNDTTLIRRLLEDDSPLDDSDASYHTRDFMVDSESEPSEDLD